MYTERAQNVPDPIIYSSIALRRIDQTRNGLIRAVDAVGEELTGGCWRTRSGFPLILVALGTASAFAEKERDAFACGDLSPEQEAVVFDFRTGSNDSCVHGDWVQDPFRVASLICIDDFARLVVESNVEVFGSL